LKGGEVLYYNAIAKNVKELSKSIF